MLTDVEKVRLKVGLNNPQFPILCDEEIEYLIEEAKGNLETASMKVAMSALMNLAYVPTRERAGDEEVWQDPAAAYRKALELFIKKPTMFNSIPNIVVADTFKVSFDPTDCNNVCSKSCSCTSSQMGIRCSCEG